MQRHEGPSGDSRAAKRKALLTSRLVIVIGALIGAIAALLTLRAFM